MNYLTTLKIYFKTFKKSWQLLIILHPVKINALRVHRKIGLMLKSSKNKWQGKAFQKFPKSRLHVDKDIRKQGVGYKN